MLELDEEGKRMKRRSRRRRRKIGSKKSERRRSKSINHVGRTHRHITLRSGRVGGWVGVVKRIFGLVQTERELGKKRRRTASELAKRAIEQGQQANKASRSVRALLRSNENKTGHKCVEGGRVGGSVGWDVGIIGE